MNNQGWVKLHRKMLQWEWYSDRNTRDLMIHLLLTANHEDARWKGILIRKGQTLTGRKKLSRDTGLSEQEVRTSLIRLKSTNEITIESTKRYSLVTLLQWDKYQSNEKEQPIIQPTAQPTTNQQSTTNKNDKKEKKIRNIYTLEKLRNGEITTILLQEFTGVDIKVEVSKMINYIDSKGKVYKNYLAFARNWLLNGKAVKKGSQTDNLQKYIAEGQNFKEQEKKYYDTPVKTHGMVDLKEVRAKLPSHIQQLLGKK